MNRVKYAPSQLQAISRMALIVQKYGGTSVGSVERIGAVADRVARFKSEGHDVVVVVSAMSGETNRLLALAKEIQANPAPRELDALLSTGEKVTTALLSMALHERDVRARSYSGNQVGILTDSAHNKARIQDIKLDTLKSELDAGGVPVVAGFQGVDVQGNVTTLGRGGSDTTAVAFAAAFDAERCDIYTDVDGVYTTDPRISSKARKLDKIAFEEMLELASLGAKVLQTRSVELAMRFNVRLRVLSSFEDPSDTAGTLVCAEEEIMESNVVAGVAYSRDEAKMTLISVADRPGIAAAIFGPLSEAGVNVDMIVQNISEDGRTDMTFSCPTDQVLRAEKAMQTAKDEGTINYHDLVADEAVAKVSVVGIGMRSHAGVAAQMFRALHREGINIKVITTSEIKISVLIERKYMELAVQTLHDAFELEKAA